MSRDGDNRHIVPFWSRIPLFFIYPLLPPAIIVLLICAGLLSGLLSSSSFFGLLAAIVVVAVVVKYLYEAVAYTAHGYLRPPPLTGQVMVEGYGLFFKQIVIFLVLGNIGAALLRMTDFHPLAVFGWSVLFSATVPAIIMILALERSLLQAINPLIWVGLIGRLGWRYLVLLGLLFCLNSGLGFVLQLLLSNALEIRNVTTGMLFVAMLVSAYYFLVMFHLMGYVLYQCHDELGYDPEYKEDSDEPDRPASEWVSELYDQYAEVGNYAAAAEELKEVLRVNPDNFKLRLRLHRLLQLAEDTRQLSLHGRDLIPRLLDADLAREARQIYLECRQADPDFKPSREIDYEPLAQNLLLAGENQSALALLSGFHKQYPNSERIPRLYLLAARILGDKLQRHAEAMDLLRLLRQRYPQDETAAIEAYHRQLENRIQRTD